LSLKMRDLPSCSQLREPLRWGFMPNFRKTGKCSQPGGLIRGRIFQQPGRRSGRHDDMARQPDLILPTPDRCLNEHEWWLWRLCGPEPILNAQHGPAFSHLARGFTAAAQRQRRVHHMTGSWPTRPRNWILFPVARFCRHGGWDIGCCPLRCFFSYVLEISPRSWP
jgi:hypothetical protein